MKYNKKTIGKNIRKERISRNISIDELAEMLCLSPAFVGLIERGQRGAKIDNLIKISEIFNTDINNIIYGSNNFSHIVSEDKEKPREVKVKTLITLMYDLDEKEIDFIISIVRNLKKLRNIKEVNTDYDYDYEEDED